MKHIMIMLLLFVFANATQAQDTGTTKKSKKTAKAVSKTITPKAPEISFEKAEISFAEKEHNFGNLIDGPEAVHTFTFYNIGKEPLVLSGAQPSCSCTVSDYTHEPIMPGKSGIITVKYGTKGHMGSFTKTISVTSNGITNPVSLTISGTVIAAPQETH